MHCPICKANVPLKSPEMPFCSERCRLIDLANWADEKYVIPEAILPEDLSEPGFELPPLEGNSR